MSARLSLGCLVFSLQVMWCGPLSADKFRIAAKPSQEKRLAPELEVLRHCNGRLVGFCRQGKPIIDVPSDQTNILRSMALSVDDKAPQVAHRPMRLLISYEPIAGKPSTATITAAGLRTVEDYDRGSFLIVEPVETVSARTVETLLNDNAVVHAAPDYVMSVPANEVVRFVEVPTETETPTDPLWSHLWGMKNIQANKVWRTHRDAANIIVAVIDTGVDYTHPDLKANMWTKGGRHGYDFFDDDAEPLDEQGHGTHVAGTIGAEGNNGAGVVGVCWKTQIMAMRFLGPDGSGSTADAVKCIDWAVANGAHVMCNSWAGPDTSQELGAAIARAEQRGVLFVAAAGNTVNRGNNNDVSPYYPAALPYANMLTVGAIDVNNAVGSFSHYGKISVDIGAPGVGIVSAMPNNRYAQLDGTSMAAPHVAGAAALVWAKTFPTPAQTPTQMTRVRDLILQNARPVPALQSLWGHASPARVPGGVLDLSFLVETSVPSTPQPTPRRRFVENRAYADPAKFRQ